MQHRIFIAINLPENIKKKLASYQEKVEELFTPYRNEVSGAGPIRWVKSYNLHITLAFLGYLSDEELLKVCNITRAVASKHKLFFINLKKICYGPTNKRPPRMVWIEGEKSEELGKFQKNLENSLSGLPSGLEGEEDKSSSSPFAIARESEKGRGYVPHITLGRLKLWEFRAIEPEERPEVNEEINLSFEVNSIDVMESELKRGGPTYTLLESCPLKS